MKYYALVEKYEVDSLVVTNKSLQDILLGEIQCWLINTI